MEEIDILNGLIQYKAYSLVSDNADAEHNEMWPRGRTNHYWFDLNRDWLLAVHPESQGKLKMVSYLVSKCCNRLP